VRIEHAKKLLSESCHYFFHMPKAIPDLIKELAEQCVGTGSSFSVLYHDAETLRQMSELLNVAKDMMDRRLEKRKLSKAFNEAVVAGDLDEMKRAHCELGSPDLAEYDCDINYAMNRFIKSREKSGTFDADFDVSEHLAWLQGVGARWSPEDDWPISMTAFSALISQGLDLTDMDLMECCPTGHGYWLTEEVFVGTKKGDTDFILSLLKAGAGLWPLDLPGASVDEPPATDSDGELQRSDGGWIAGGGWEEHDYRTLFWPGQFPRHGAGLKDYPPVEEIRESVTAVCSFFADKREKERCERCEAAWQRRRLVVLCANRVGPKAAEESEAAPKGPAKQKRHKAAELTGLRALVRGVMAQQLWRTVVGYL